MPQRRGQKYIGFKCDPALRDEIVEAADGNLSQFLRDALVEKLDSLGYDVSGIVAEAPSRIGKGGPKKLTQEMGGMKQSIILNTSPGPSAPIKPVKYDTKKKFKP